MPGFHRRAASSLPFVFALVDTLEHSEPGFLCVRDGERLELGWRVEHGNHLAHRFSAGRACGV